MLRSLPQSAPRTSAANASDAYDVDFAVPFRQRLRFTRDVLTNEQQILLALLEPSGPAAPKVQLWVDDGVAERFAGPLAALEATLATDPRFDLTMPLQRVPGGEACKRDPALMERLWAAFNACDMDRRSYVVCIGGGAVLDAVGYATATAHRGLRIIRLPTTTLGQADSGVGVKNAINQFDKKNWLGTFAVPWAVINDTALIEGLPDRDFLCGFAEAVKVTLLKSGDSFSRLCDDAPRIRRRDMDAARRAIRDSVMLHLHHITHGGDPFEAEMARPLDFGHWSAHKLEPMTRYEVRHGEAVAIGVALDCIYSHLRYGFASTEVTRVLRCFNDLGLATSHPFLADKDVLFDGLEEFRQHLGGELTITMLKAPGHPVDVHEVDYGAMGEAIDMLIALSGRRVTSSDAA